MKTQGDNDLIQKLINQYEESNKKFREMIFDTVLYSEGAFTISELKQIPIRDLLELQKQMASKAEKQREALNPKNRKVL